MYYPEVSRKSLSF